MVLRKGLTLCLSKEPRLFGLISSSILDRTDLVSGDPLSNQVQQDSRGFPRSGASSRESRVLTGFFQLDSRDSASAAQGGRATVWADVTGVTVLHSL